MALDYTGIYSRLTRAEDLMMADKADDNMTMVA
jgi:hypothetical protein